MTTLIPQFDLKNGGATPIGAVNRAINLKLAESISILDFGADPTGVTDSSTAIQAAITSLNGLGGSIHAPAGTYLLNNPITIASGIHLYGDGWGNSNGMPVGATSFVSSSVDLFIGSATNVSGCIFERFNAKSNIGGGHIFNFSQAGGVSNVEFRNLTLIQNNTAKAVVNATTGSFEIWMHDFSYAYQASNTIPALNFSNPFPSHIVIENFISYGTNTSTGTYSILIEGTGIDAAPNCSIRNGVFEQPHGGAVKLMSAATGDISNVRMWDLTVVPANSLIYIGKYATNPASSATIKLEEIYSTYGNGAIFDLQIAPTSSNISINNSYILYTDGITKTYRQFASNQSYLVNTSNIILDNIANSYVPTLINATASSTSCTYQTYGNKCYVQGTITVSAITGQIEISLPIQPNATNIFGVGSCVAIKASTVAAYSGTTVIQNISSVGYIILYGNGNTYGWGTTTPFTWSSGDLIQFSVEYFL